MIKVVIGTNDEFSSEEDLFQHYCLGTNRNWCCYSVCDSINDYPMDMIWRIAKSKLFDDDWTAADTYYFLTDSDKMEML